jgi:Mce-associated membrane protein
MSTTPPDGSATLAKLGILPPRRPVTPPSAPSDGTPGAGDDHTAVAEATNTTDPAEVPTPHNGALCVSDDHTVPTETTGPADPTPSSDSSPLATPEPPGHHRFRRHRLPAALLAVAVLLAAAGAWFTLETHAAATSVATTNQALTDVAGTADVTSAVSLALNKVFSYSYDKTDVTEKAADTVLHGKARDSYDKLFADVLRMAPSQKIVLASRVSEVSVQQLDGNHAQLLAFLDQSATRADNGTTSTAAAQLSVTAERVDGSWVVTDLSPR